MEQYLVIVSVHLKDDEIQSFISCQKFDLEGAKKFREDILRQMNNVQSGDKNQIIIECGDMALSDMDSVTVIPAEVVLNNPIVIDVAKDLQDVEDVEDSNDTTYLNSDYTDVPF